MSQLIVSTLSRDYGFMYALLLSYQYTYAHLGISFYHGSRALRKADLEDNLNEGSEIEVNRAKVEAKTSVVIGRREDTSQRKIVGWLGRASC